EMALVRLATREDSPNGSKWRLGTAAQRRVGASDAATLRARTEYVHAQDATLKRDFWSGELALALDIYGLPLITGIEPFTRLGGMWADRSGPELHAGSSQAEYIGASIAADRWQWVGGARVQMGRNVS